MGVFLLYLVYHVSKAKPFEILKGFYFVYKLLFCVQWNNMPKYAEYIMVYIFKNNTKCKFYTLE